MQIHREIELEAAAADVWDTLWDVPRMVTCVPGCVEASEAEPGRRWDAKMRERVGPIALSIPLSVRAVEVEAPRRLVLEANGRDGLVGATGAVRLVLALAATGTGTGTRLVLDADARVLGKLGALGHGVIQRKADEVLDGFLARLRGVVSG